MIDKTDMQRLFLSLLAALARGIVTVHRPYVIGVTGTAWKTTISTHIAHFIESQFGKDVVMYSRFHYNGEFWLPLTIIGSRTPGRNPILWLWVCIVAITRLIRPYPKYLVLEYGIDHPGEMDFLISIVMPDIAVIAPIEPNHIEQFWSLPLYRSEKLKLIVSSTVTTIAHESLRQYIERDVLYYSMGAMSDIDASSITIHPTGTDGIVHYKNKDYTISVPAVGAFQIENMLPLYPISEKLQLDPSVISVYAKTASPESGRSNFLQGIDRSVIIDGSYNWGYMSMREGIVSLVPSVYAYQIILFLGDMRELGDASRNIHTDLAHDIVDILPHDQNIHIYLVWPMMRDYVAPILKKYFTVEVGLSSKIIGSKIKHTIHTSKKTALVYVKWSQNTIFLEEWIKVFLQNHQDQAKLVRQSKSWLRKKETFFRNIESD